jgi:hypothetical protein
VVNLNVCSEVSCFSFQGGFLLEIVSRNTVLALPVRVPILVINQEDAIVFSLSYIMVISSPH